MDEKNYMMGLYQQRPRVGIEMSGVLSYTEDCLRCNSQDIIKTVMDGVEKLKPKKDWNGGFAGHRAMRILEKKYEEAQKIPFIREPMAWALYHTWREFDDGKRCD